jgi:FkbM family methyltransferase
VHAFEPWPPEFARCRANVELNGLTNVVLNRTAVSDIDGSATFLGSEGDNQSDGFLCEGAGGIACETVRLDTYLRTAGPVHLIKLDAQGADLRALRGAEACLARWRPAVLLTSCQDAIYARFGTSIEEVSAFMRARGYRVTWLRPASLLPRVLRTPQFPAALWEADQ